MARTDNLTNFVTDIANALREKTNDSAVIPCSEYDSVIQNLATSSTKFIMGTESPIKSDKNLFLPVTLDFVPDIVVIITSKKEYYSMTGNYREGTYAGVYYDGKHYSIKGHSDRLKIEIGPLLEENGQYGIRFNTYISYHGNANVWMAIKF